MSTVRVAPSGLVLSAVAIAEAVGRAMMAGYRSVAGRAGAPAQEGRVQGRRVAVGREHASVVGALSVSAGGGAAWHAVLVLTFA